LPDEASPLGKKKAEHAHRIRIRMNWQADRSGRSDVNISKQLICGHLPVKDIPVISDEASQPMAEIMCGDGYFSINARNQSVPELR
jgi:hypothetical protein